MAGLGDLLQRVARSLEEAGAQGPADDLRARLGYGAGEDDEDELAEETVWEPEPRQETAPAPASGAPPPATESIWTPRTRSATAPEAPRISAADRTQAPHRVHGAWRSPPVAPPHRHAAPASPLAHLVRARLRTPDALREAFVVKELLDRPLARRYRR